MKYHVYILQTQDGSYYTGITKDLQERLGRHNSGRGAKFTKTKGSLSLVYHEESVDLKSAMKRERQIKDYSRLKKKNLIKAFRDLQNTEK